jgi:hypothetical protein
LVQMRQHRLEVERHDFECFAHALGPWSWFVPFARQE